MNFSDKTFIPHHFFPNLVVGYKIQEKRLRLQKAADQELGWKWWGMLSVVVKNYLTTPRASLNNF